MRITLVLALALTLGPTITAHAQGGDATEPGTWAPPPAAQPQPQPTPPAQGATPQWYNQQEQERPPVLGGREDGGAQQSEPAEEPNDPGDSDHAGVIGVLGVGFMGTQSLPIGTIDGMGVGVESLTAPTVGVRYWLSENLGLDVGLGFALNTATVDTNGATAATTVLSESSSYGFSVHAGMPIVFHHRAHYKLLMIPALDFGFTSGSRPGVAFNNSFDDIVGGLAFRLSGTIGAEIHFGFMGIPELSVQAGVGLNLSYISVSNDICQDPNCSNMTLQNSVAGWSIGTTVNGQPWQILTGALTALYYFD